MSSRAIKFLKSKGLDPDDLSIYNMKYTDEPKLPLLEWLIEFESILNSPMVQLEDTMGNPYSEGSYPSGTKSD